MIEEGSCKEDVQPLLGSFAKVSKDDVVLQWWARKALNWWESLPEEERKHRQAAWPKEKNSGDPTETV